MLKFLKRFLVEEGSQKGAVNLNGLILMGMAMIFISVGFIIYPIVMTGTDAILAYQYSSNASITDATFTGLTSVTGVVPLLVLLGFTVSAVITGFLGYKATKSGGSSTLDSTNLMMMGIGLVFIAIGLIIYPVTLDGIASVLHNGGNGLSASYTGLSAILGVIPLLVLVGFTVAGVVLQYFGTARTYKSAKGY